ncbi:hypothetical protein [Acidithiobacillus thiooxidans]|uniref:hypothetical protein n=1 Tax=Acidithiobacillus thiooxidans TaxID=930 RepID=UPI001F523D81|nr:hypothetical protein [Acidithiobacillus thiooxidans]
MRNPFRKKTSPSVVDEQGPINGISGSSDTKQKKPLTTKQKTWISVAVLAFVGLIAANKIMGPAKPAENSSGTVSQGFAPMTPPKKTVASNSVAKHPDTAPLMGATPGKMTPMTTAVKPVQVTSYNNAQAIQNILSMASNNTVTMLQSWSGPDGLTGVLYRDINGKEGVAWVNTAKQLVMIGTLVGANGTNYNTSSDFALAAQTHEKPASDSTSQPESGSSSNSTLGQLMSGGSGFTEGKAGRPELTVFIDPNSAIGHQLFTALSPKIHDGKIRVRYVPVAEKNKSSLHKAEEIMAAPSPAEEMRKNERLFRKASNGTMGGGIRGVPSTLDMVQEIDNNTALVATAGYISSPVMVYCDKAGKHQVAVGQAAVGDLNAIMNNLGMCKAF